MSVDLNGDIELRSTPESLGREGMVTVWTSDGLYVGCMGIKTWQGLLAAESERARGGASA